MDIKQVTQLSEMLKNSKLQTINFSDTKTKISINKAKVIHQSSPVTSNQSPVEHQPQAKEVQPEINKNIKEITSEGVGIFYPSVEQREIDAHVRIVKGRELYFVKAMNLENHKRLDFDCKVVNFLVEPGKAVEYGQPLVSVEVL